MRATFEINEPSQDQSNTLLTRRNKAIRSGMVEEAIRLTAELEGLKPINTRENPFPRDIRVADVAQLGVERNDPALSDTFNPRHFRFMEGVAEQRALSRVGHSLGSVALEQVATDRRNVDSARLQAQHALNELGDQIRVEQAQMASDMVGQYRLDEDGGFTVMSDVHMLTGSGPANQVEAYLRDAGYQPVEPHSSLSGSLPDVRQHLHNQPAPARS